MVGVKGTQKCVDDILISAPDMDTLMQRISQVLYGCRKNGITISHKKLKIGTELPFAGYIVGGDGVKPNPKKTEAIMNFPAPTNVSELRSFFGMVNQFDPFTPDLAHARDPLNNLLKKNVAWVWLDDHEKSFQLVKKILSEKLMLHHYNEKLPMELLKMLRRQRSRRAFQLREMSRVEFCSNSRI